MNLKLLLGIAGFFVLALVLNTNAQLSERVSSSLGNQNAKLTSTLIDRLIQNQQRKPAKTSSTHKAAFTFNPVGDSGVTRDLAEALGQDEGQKTALKEVFSQLKQGYEAEVSKEGKSNNLAAALTFFIAANVATYGQTEMPSNEATDELFQSIQEAMTGVPAFGEMTDAEKQRMHDWLVCMGGLAITNYLAARQAGDQQALANIKTFADYSIRLVLGLEASKLNFSATGLRIEGNSSNSAKASPQQTPGADSRIIGTWKRKAAVANSNLVTNSGYYVCRYAFGADGTYTFKSERWDGYLRSEEWWTTEETGAFSLSGNSLILTPGKSVSTLRNRAGAVQKIQNNPLERAVFQWQISFSAELNETHLVLTAPREVGRYGGFSSDSRFPNSYVFDQTSVIEWKF